LNHSTADVGVRNLYSFIPKLRRAIRRVSAFGFEEGQDFRAFLRESSGGRPSREYTLSIDMA